MKGKTDMMVYRATDLSVVLDDFVYKFDSKEEADLFDQCLENNPLGWCRIHFRPRETHRRPARMAPLISILGRADERRNAMLEQGKEARRELVDAGRRYFDGKDVYYVVHGHGGYFQQLHLAMPGHSYRKTRIRFYCARGETTQHTERRNINNAPAKLMKALLGSKADNSRVHETVEPGQPCEPLMVQAEPDPLLWPMQGIYFVARDREEAEPYMVEKIAELPLQMRTFAHFHSNVILPDARKRRLKAPYEIYWVACRAQIAMGSNAVAAGAASSST